MVTTNPFTTANYVEAVDALNKTIKEQSDEIERLQKINVMQAKWLLEAEQKYKELLDKVRLYVKEDA